MLHRRMINSGPLTSRTASAHSPGAADRAGSVGTPTFDCQSTTHQVTRRERTARSVLESMSVNNISTLRRPARRSEYAAYRPSGESAATSTLPSSGVRGSPLPPIRPALASNGNAHRRVDCRCTVNARWLPSREIAAAASGPEPVVNRSAVSHSRVAGSTRTLQTFRTSFKIASR